MKAFNASLDHQNVTVFAFNHIPRTGGNFLMSALYASAAKERKTFIFGLPYPIDRQSVCNVFRCGEGKYIFHGHGAADLTNLLPQREISYFTFLREPVSRAISEFLWLIRRLPRDERSPRKLIDLAHVWAASMTETNHQVRFLARPLGDRIRAEDAHMNLFDHLNGPIDEDFERACHALEDMFFVGITERMTSDSEGLATLLGMQPCDGTSRNPNPHADISALLWADTALVEEIKEKGRWDELIYARAIKNANLTKPANPMVYPSAGCQGASTV
jgi:hypothetical protein